jgi:hypothetical protein
MRPAGRVIREVLAEDPAQVLRIGHDDVIQTLSANGTDNAFYEGIWPRRTRRCQHTLFRQALDTSLDSLAVDGIAISQ